MPAAVLGPIIAAGIAGGTSIVGAKMQSGATSRAVNAQTAAANRAAELQAQSTREALAFERQSAQNAYANSETSRRGNYDQWAARERRLGSIGELLGYGTREVPGYVAGVDPRFTDPSTGAPPTTGYVAPPTLPTYAAGTGSNGLTPPPVSRTMPVPYGSVGSYLQPQIHPGVLMPDPYRYGSVGSYLR